MAFNTGAAATARAASVYRGNLGPTYGHAGRVTRSEAHRAYQNESFGPRPEPQVTQSRAPYEAGRSGMRGRQYYAPYAGGGRRSQGNPKYATNRKETIA